MLSIQKDLTPHIILDRKYDWSFVFKNPIIQRPKGDIILVMLLKPSFGRCFKLYIIKNGNSYFILAQLKIFLSGDQRIQHSKKVMKYYKDSRRKPIQHHILDLTNPWYNVEWYFALTESFYNTIFERLSKIHIPLKPCSIGLDSTTREIFINTGCSIHIEWRGHKEHHWNELTNFTDGLFDFALTKFDTAYLKK